MTDRTPKPDPTREPITGETLDHLLARLGDAFEADGTAIERVKARARAGRPSRSAFGGWALRLAVASALTVLVAVGAWRLETGLPTPRKTPPTRTLETNDPPARSTEPEDAPTLVISNESGFVTVRSGASQWLVLPGDLS